MCYIYKKQRAERRGRRRSKGEERKKIRRK